MIKKIHLLFVLAFFSCEKKEIQSPVSLWQPVTKKAEVKFYTSDTTFKKQAGYVEIQGYVFAIELSYRNDNPSCEVNTIHSLPVWESSFTVNIYKYDSSLYKTFSLKLPLVQSEEPQCAIFDLK